MMTRIPEVRPRSAPRKAVLAPKPRYPTQGLNGIMGRRDRRRAGAGLLVVSLLALGILSSAAMAVPSHGRVTSGSPFVPAQGSPRTWSNGKVTLDFPWDRPTFSLAAVNNSTMVVNQSLTQIAEIAPNRTIVSVASLSNGPSPWQFAAVSTPSSTTVNVSAMVAVFPGGGEWESGDDSTNYSRAVGFANVTFTFVLNASTAANPYGLEYDLAITGWPWAQSTDTLGVEVRSNASYANGIWKANGLQALSEVSLGSGRAIADFNWAGAATAYYTGGSHEDSSIGSYQNLSNGGQDYLIRLEFAAVTGGYTSLAYDPTIAFVVPGPPVPSIVPAWVLTQSSLEILGGGAGLCLGLAILARVRRTPPDSGL